jgi:hypothetical protein
MQIFLFYLGHDLYGQQGQNSKYQAYALKLWQCAAERGHKKAHFFCLYIMKQSG